MAGRNRIQILLNQRFAVLAILLTALLFGAACARERQTGGAKNAILIVVDTLRRDHLPVYGYARETSPAIDRLAAEGAVFEGLSPTSWTKPAMASILTGLHPVRHQAFSESDGIPDAATTVAERLRAAGFSTLGIASNAWVSRAWGFDRGFDKFVPLWRENQERFPKPREATEAVLANLSRLRSPFFLFVHYLDPHQPYDPETSWDGSPLTPGLAKLRPLRLEGGDLSALARDPAGLQAAVDLYDGEIRGTDEAIGNLLRSLGAQGYLKDTVVVLAADHGEEFLEHGNVGHGKSLYREVVEVPLVFSLPGRIPAGRRLGRASLLSIVPTLLDLLEVRASRSPGDFDGPSLAAELTSGSRDRSDGDFLYQLDLDGISALALSDSRRKLVLGKSPRVTATFDLAADAAESHNTAASPRGMETLSRLGGLLSDRFNDLMRRSFERKSSAADDDLKQQIRALGYLKTFSEVGDRRSFPRRLRPPDRDPAGLGGWENLEAFRPCGEVSELADDQFVSGFYPPELGGRWTAAAASLALPVRAPAASLQLVLEGASYRPSAYRFSISLDGRELGRRVVAPGPFRLEFPVPGLASADAHAIFRLESDPEFRPRSVGLADDRSLGTYLRRICLGPSVGGKP